MPRPLPVEPPAHIAALPTDPRGYFVPAEAPWTADGPKLADLDPHRKTALGFRRACCVCGFTLTPGEPVWRAFSQRDAALTRLHGRELDVDSGGPGHLSCMMFSAFACPYWASPVGRLGKNSTIAPGAPRGTRPAVLGFRDVWLLVHEDPRRPLLGPGAPDMKFGYVELLHDIPFRSPEDLLERYDTARAHDEEMIDTAGRRSYWRRTQQDHDELRDVLDCGVEALHSKPSVRQILYNREPRTGFELPLD